jgi:hypothetical protein
VLTVTFDASALASETPSGLLATPVLERHGTQ